ncbi:FecR domain-containing protein [Chitinophaga horti]|uniref:FecR domain-containing protein n=1 Tax=Chitinophaga horti TaxID=2920382 RepID=A0ABY6J2M4_9BACT|nr:FecR family protein [Chitinophaga horti]UYQ93823.1 FecR domain-containing protein [Chitinophaga horti]
MDIQQLRELLARYASDSLSEPERQLLLQYMNDAELRPLIETILEETFIQSEYSTPEPAARGERFTRLLHERMHPVKRLSTRRFYWPAAAAVALLLAAGAWYWSTHPTQSTTTVAQSKKDIQPGRNGAILTLADGAEIVLDSLQNGLVAQQQGSQVMLANGQLQYNSQGQTEGELQYNTISTPKGRQFRLLLPDGSAVWLNAASSIRYPTAFTNKERRVTITGEAYFEVAQHANQPFFISVNNQQEVAVLGTDFNINAYTNESYIQTTLLNGSVSVKAAGKAVVLQPGQQAQLAHSGTSALTVQTDVDTDRVLAWKNGAFNFDQLTLEESMRLLERWYDIDVVYEHGVPDIRFGGEIDRNVSLEELLKILGRTKLKFRIEENRKLVIIK